MSETAATSFSESELVNPKFEISLPKGSVNEFPLQRYEGVIDLVNSAATLEAAQAEMARETILGFDTETRPVFRRGQSYPPALLQLAGADKVWLFQLQLLPDPGPLFAILSSPDVVKAGVAIRDDIKKLQEILSFQPGGFVELSDSTRKAGVVNTGLRNLCALFLRYRISKGAQVSNWAKPNLTPAQITYAATDAWVSRELYLRLAELGLIGPLPAGD